MQKLPVPGALCDPCSVPIDLWSLLRTNRSSQFLCKNCRYLLLSVVPPLHRSLGFSANIISCLGQNFCPRIRKENSLHMLDQLYTKAYRFLLESFPPLQCNVSGSRILKDQVAAAGSGWVVWKGSGSGLDSMPEKLSVYTACIVFSTVSKRIRIRLISSTKDPDPIYFLNQGSGSDQQ